MKHVLSLSAVLLCTHIFAQKPEQFQSADLSFVPNKGQFVTEEQKPATTVQFKANVSGLEFYITDAGISYVFVKQNRDDYDPALGGKPNPDFKQTEDFARVDMNLLGANIDRNKVETEFPTNNKFNYYYAHCPDGILGLSGYHQLTYKNVYPNIDWVISCLNHKDLKYSFIVHPGGNPADIKLEYKYADVKVSDDNIVLSTPMGEISEQQLYCYSKETGLKVSANYDCRGNYVSINAAAPKGETLVIDPPLVWATYWGGAGAEQPQALVCSGTGEYVFVSGYTGSVAYPTLNPGGGTYFQGALAGGTDAFIAKFDTSGVLFWSTYYGGTGSEGSTSYTGVSIACGQGNSLWMVGTTNSTNLPLQNPGGGAYYQAALAGANDFFIIKFNLAGVRSYCTYYGGTLDDGGLSHGCGADCDASGNFYFSGRVVSTNFPLMNPGGGAYYDASQNGSNDLCVVKLSPAGVLLWSTYLGGTGDDMNYSMDLHVDKTNSKLYVATCTSSLDIPTMNPGAPYYYDGTENGLTDMYFARFTLAGVMTWATYIGGSGDEWLAMSVNSAPDGDIALITLTGSVDMPCVNPGGSAFFDNTQNGSWDIYLCRLESTGQMSWSTYYGSPNNEHCQHNLTFDANGNVIMCGVSDGAAAPPTFNPGPPHYYDGVKDAMGTYCLIQFSPVGVMLWGTYWGGSGHDHLFGTVGKCIGVSAHSDIFVCGETTSTDLPTLNPGGGAYYNTTPGQGFVTKFNNDIIPPVVLPIELLYWHCESTADGIVLRWQTATETDNDYFTIERTTDGANWEYLATIDGSGTTSMMHEYKYVDNAPFTGNNYYRLSQTDFNGNKQSFNYTVCDYVGKNALMNVYTVSGQLLFSEYTNDYRNTLSKSGIAPGVYLIELVNGTDKITVKYMKTDQ